MYLCEDTVDQERAVVKVLSADNDEIRQRLLEEVRAIKYDVHSEYVVRCIDAGELPDGSPFVATEYREESLRNRISKLVPMDWKEAAKLAAQLADGLSRVHKSGLVHGGVEPRNIAVVTELHDRVRLNDASMRIVQLIGYRARLL